MAPWEHIEGLITGFYLKWLRESQATAVDRDRSLWWIKLGLGIVAGVSIMNAALLVRLLQR